MILLNYRDSRPIYAQICAALRQQIAAGVLQPGEKLESVREMAARLAINPNTIQRAYRELEEDGWIASVPGKGSFVCAVAPEERPEAHWQAFDAAVTELLHRGVSREALIERIQQTGGTADAEA